MVLSVSCTCCALVSASAECCGYLCYLSAVMRQWPLWSNPVPLSLIQCTCVVPLFLRCYVIRHMVLIALKREKVLRLPLRSYRLYNRISQFRFDSYTGTSHDSTWANRRGWYAQAPPHSSFECRPGHCRRQWHLIDRWAARDTHVTNGRIHNIIQTTWALARSRRRRTLPWHKRRRKGRS